MGEAKRLCSACNSFGSSFWPCVAPPHSTVAPSPTPVHSFLPPFLHIGVRQGALPKLQVGLESVASPWGSPQLGGEIRLFP
jgi:hypothetical protein